MVLSWQCMRVPTPPFMPCGWFFLITHHLLGRPWGHKYHSACIYTCTPPTRTQIQKHPQTHTHTHGPYIYYITISKYYTYKTYIASILVQSTLYVYIYNIHTHNMHTVTCIHICNISIYVYIYIYIIVLPVVPHKAVAEVSKIGNL